MKKRTRNALIAGGFALCGVIATLSTSLSLYVRQPDEVNIGLGVITTGDMSLKISDIAWKDDITTLSPSSSLELDYKLGGTLTPESTYTQDVVVGDLTVTVKTKSKELYENLGVSNTVSYLTDSYFDKVEGEPELASGKQRIYFVDQGWWNSDSAKTKIYCYKDGSSGVENAAFPGVEMSLSMNDAAANQNVWYYDFDIGAYDRFIFIRTNPTSGADWGARTDNVTLGAGKNTVVLTPTATWYGDSEPHQKCVVTQDVRTPYVKDLKNLSFPAERTGTADGSGYYSLVSETKATAVKVAGTDVKLTLSLPEEISDADLLASAGKDIVVTIDFAANTTYEYAYVKGINGKWTATDETMMVPDIDAADLTWKWKAPKAYSGATLAWKCSIGEGWESGSDNHTTAVAKDAVIKWKGPGTRATVA